MFLKYKENFRKGEFYFTWLTLAMNNKFNLLVCPSFKVGFYVEINFMKRTKVIKIIKLSDKLQFEYFNHSINFTILFDSNP